MFWGLGQNPFGWAFLAGVFPSVFSPHFTCFLVLRCMAAHASDYFFDLFVSAFRRSGFSGNSSCSVVSEIVSIVYPFASV
jgi:hypothetical protein